MVWGKQAVQKLMESCWQCGHRFKAEQTICIACGAVRVPEELAPKLAIPTNGWYEPPEPFHIPTRFGRASSRPVTEEEAQAAGEKAAQPDESAFPPPVAQRAYVPSQPMERSLEANLPPAQDAAIDAEAPAPAVRLPSPSLPLRMTAWIRSLMAGEQDETRL